MIELGEIEREVDWLLQRLTHPEDAAAAQLHARVARELGRPDPIVVGVRRADRREERPAGLEVVVVTAHAGGGESPRLVGLEQPERTRDLEAGLALHRV